MSNQTSKITLKVESQRLSLNLQNLKSNCISLWKSGPMTSNRSENF